MDTWEERMAARAAERAQQQAEREAADREAARMARLITDRAEMEARPVGTVTDKPTNPDPLDGHPPWAGAPSCERCYARPGLWEWTGTEWRMAAYLDGHLPPWVETEWGTVDNPGPGESNIWVANPTKACTCPCHYVAYA